MKEISGKVAFVTGAANGIGLGICRALARAGAHVALADIQPDALERARGEIAALGVRAIALQLDVSDADAVSRAADAVEAAFGNVHIVCNNAGIALGSRPVVDVTSVDLAWIFGVNVFGVLNGVRAFVPRIRAHGEGGHVVNTASMAGLQVNRALPGIGPYAMTKHAVVALSDALEQELQGSGIGVSVLCPAQVDTTLYDSGKRRPERFGGSYTRSDLSEARNRASTGLSPDAAGERVLHAIRHDEFFIFTHPEARARVAERHARMMAGFDAAERYNAER
jgi:NAD(P)-dependent dehydrogenase (short-subunit alcohol dehydrogenase family)